MENQDFINKITCMDCIDGMKLLQNNSIDLIVTDPPYNFVAHGSGFMTKAKKEYLNKIHDDFGNDFDPLPFLQELPRIMKKMNFYVWCSKNLIYVYLKWAVENGYLYDVLTWHKKNPVPLWNNKYLSDTEYCIFIYDKGKYFNSNLGDWRKYKKWFLTRIGEDSNNHTTPKPMITMKTPIEVSSKEGDVVLDPFMGGGLRLLHVNN